MKHAKRSPTLAEKKHMGRVVELGCIACRNAGLGDSPAEFHHLRNGAGAGQRSPHTRGIPLCPKHHRLGGYGVAYHAGPKAWEATFGTEVELLAQVERELDPVL